MSSDESKGDNESAADNGKTEETPSLPLKAVRYVQIARDFAALGISSFDAHLPEGRIDYLDAQGAVVASGRCSAILSHAGQNDSILWARAIPDFKDAGVPTLDPPEGMNDYQEDVSAEQAEHLANEAAGRADADFYYAAPSGDQGVLFLAVFEFTRAQVH